MHEPRGTKDRQGPRRGEKPGSDTHSSFCRGPRPREQHFPDRPPDSDLNDHFRVFIMFTPLVRFPVAVQPGTFYARGGHVWLSQTPPHP